MAQVSCTAVLAMLAECVPGYSLEWKTHHIWIRFRGRTFPAFPKGKKIGHYNFEVQIGKVRKLARTFGVVDCARTFFPEI